MRMRTFLTTTALAAATITPVVATSTSADAAPVRTWDRIAHCESGGRWHINTGNGYFGGLQISKSTWDGFGGRKFAKFPHGASKPQQIRIAERIQHGQGWGAWPSCA